MQLTINLNVVVPIFICTLIIAIFSTWQLQKTARIWRKTGDVVMALVTIFLMATLADELWSLLLQAVDLFIDRSSYLQPMRWLRLIERIFAIVCLIWMRSIYLHIKRQHENDTGNE